MQMEDDKLSNEDDQLAKKEVQKTTSKLKSQASLKIDDIMEAKVFSVEDAKKEAKRSHKKTYWTQGNTFQCVVGLLIVSNAVILGLEVDHAAELGDALFVFQHFFTASFLVEMLCRWITEGLRHYFSTPMSQFDFLLVVAGIIDVWILEPLAADSEGLRMLTIFRLMRLVRLLRITRVLRVFKELGVIGGAFAAGFRTLFWGLAFLGIVVYVFGIMAVERFGRATDCVEDEMDSNSNGRLLKAKSKSGGGTGDSMSNTTDVIDESGCGDFYEFGAAGTQFQFFGSLDRAMLTLYTCVTDGCGSDIIYKMAYKNPLVMVYWATFIFITTFGLVNVMIGLFCENVFSQAAEDEKQQAHANMEKRQRQLEKLKRIFQEMDGNLSNSLSRDEFHDAVQNNKEVAEILEDLELHESERLFDILDVDNSGLLDLDEFFSGSLLLANKNEPAKTRDTLGTHLVVVAMSKRMNKLSTKVKETQRSISSMGVDVKRINDRQARLEDKLEDMYGRQVRVEDKMEDMHKLLIGMSRTISVLLEPQNPPATEPCLRQSLVNDSPLRL